jgi:hypothetical protein
MSNEIRDGDWNLWSYDPLYKRTVWVIHDHESGQMHFRIDYEVEGLLEENKEAYKEAPKGWAGDYLHHIARVPLNLWYDQLEQTKGDPKALDRWLNDVDNRAWRTKKGWIG